MKICSICKLEKELDSYNKNKAKKDGLNTICRICSNKRSKRYYSENTEHHKKVILKRNKRLKKENRIKLIDFKSKGCLICDEKDVCCLDFHHLSDKENEISNMAGTGVSWNAILKEISKCILVCANCHRKIHAGKIQI